MYQSYVYHSLYYHQLLESFGSRAKNSQIVLLIDKEKRNLLIWRIEYCFNLALTTKKWFLKSFEVFLNTD